MTQPLNAAGAIAVELEKVRSSVYPQFNQDDYLYARLPVRTDLETVSDRLARIPILVQTGSQFNQFVPNGQGLGAGGGSKYDDGVTTPVYFSQACQITKQAQIATNSKQKSVVDAFKDEFKINMREFRANIDRLLSASDGTGTVGTVSSSATAGQLTVNNANNFQDQNTYQVWSSIGGTNRGTLTVYTRDLVNNILYLVGTFPPGTAANDLLIVSGSAAAANSSLNGIPAINLASSTGQWFGINRTSYPGVLSTPYYNAASGSLTPQIVQIVQSYMQRATGIKTEDLDEVLVSANLDQISAWELLGMVTTSAGGFTSGSGQTAFTQQDGGKGDRMDYMKKGRIKTMFGHELMGNLHALPGRIDLLCLNYWFRVESQPAALYDVDGITIFPLYASDGSVATAEAFYFWVGMQVATSRARSGGYVDHLAIPTGF